MNRRAFLTTGSLGAVTTLAGCFGRSETDTDESGTEPDDSENVHEPAEVTISATKSDGECQLVTTVEAINDDYRVILEPDVRGAPSDEPATAYSLPAGETVHSLEQLDFRDRAVTLYSVPYGEGPVTTHYSGRLGPECELFQFRDRDKHRE